MNPPKSPVPDFIIELRSATDRLNAVKTKMIEYQSLGLKLGLLVNPQDRPLGATHAEETSARLHPQVEIYRLESEPEILAAPMLVNCNDVMSGFTLNLIEIW